MESVNPGIHHLAAGSPRDVQDKEGRTFRTGIEKQTAGRLFLKKPGITGDDVADKKNHGGRDRAVCIYPLEHYGKWEKEFEEKLDKAAFGENITVSGMTEETVHIGDTYKVGSAVIQVTQGRIPCVKIDKRTGCSGLMNRFIETGFTGFFCRVLQEGTVQEDSAIELMEKDSRRVSIFDANHIYFHERTNIEAMKRVLDVSALAEEWRTKFEKRLRSLT
ncbi:MOSC domain-containing protein [Salibacterium halotolerans]|uniref:MOSC domain-containing protein YiiM n=1 Tax=Salibacterium halotolerans TaxID=1884432 RepID=A0A1I5TF00_9BACI|nr:MOSC domain-containing protein [Salibacterium halotolerans]SFP81528.1 MOSC domain-containing protein YiiM [Salibacterium halotolerans]